MSPEDTDNKETAILAHKVPIMDLQSRMCGMGMGQNALGTVS